MKKPVEIRLHTIHVGSRRRVVALELDGRNPAMEFLEALARGNKQGAEALKNRIQTVAERDRYENEITFRHVGDGVFEFKRNGLRLYAFYDELPGLQPQLIIATNGGTKNTKKDQEADISRAKIIRIRYHEAKSLPDTKFQLIILDSEN